MPSAPARTASTAGPTRAGSAAISAPMSTMPAWRSWPRSRSRAASAARSRATAANAARTSSSSGSAGPGPHAGSVAEVDLPGADALGHRLAPVAARCGHRPACAASRQGAEDERGRDRAGILMADAARAEVARPALQRLHGYGRGGARRGRLGEHGKGVVRRRPLRDRLAEAPWSPAPARRPSSCRPRGRRRAAGRPPAPRRARRTGRAGPRRRRLPAPFRPGGTPCRTAGPRRRRPWRSGCCRSRSRWPRASRRLGRRVASAPSTAVKPRARLMPWSASPIAASSWVRWSRLASMTPAADTIQARKTSASMMAPWSTVGIAGPSVPTAGPACPPARPRAG